MKDLKPKTLKGSIFFVSVLQTATPVLLIGIIASMITLSILRVQVFNNTSTVFTEVSSAINNFSDDIFDISQNLLYENDIVDIIAFKQDSQSYSSSSLNSILINNPSISAVKLVIDDKEFSLSQGKSSIYQYGSIGYQNIKSALEDHGRESIWYALYQNDSTSDIFFARKIKNPYTNEFRGMMFFQIAGSTFSDLLNLPDRSAYGTFNILSSNGLPIIKKFDLPQQTLEKIHHTKARLTAADGNYYFYSVLPALDWEIIYCVDKWRLYRILYLLVGLIVFLGIISVIIAAYVTQYINKTVVVPIQYLSNNMRAWTENKTFEPPKTYKILEINALYNDFEGMTKKIITLINMNYKATLIQRKAELKMLQAQINPHFIFNTLEAINSFALIYDAAEISEITLAFSALIEQSIRYQADAVHGFKQELHLTDCYLTIIRIRFGDKISVRKNIESVAYGVSLPRLSLQPIIENAVTHGIIPSGRNCVIQIDANVVGGDLIIQITDDGIGISNDTLDKLNASFIAGDNSAEESIGLINVNKRLKLLYGDAYHLEILSEENCFTKVILKVKTDSDSLKNSVHTEAHNEI